MRGIDDAFEQHLDLAAAFLVAEKARLDDAGIVEDEQVAGREQRRQVGELAVGEALTADMEHPAAAAFGRRDVG